MQFSCILPGSAEARIRQGGENKALFDISSVEISAKIVKIA